MQALLRQAESTRWIPDKAGTFYFDIWTGMDDNNAIGFTLFKGGHP
jgi:hypothetical protein